MNDLKTFLSNFLDTINYPDNKEEFINNLLSAIYLDAVDESLKTLPQEKQTEIQEKFKTVTTPEAIQEVVSSNFDQNLFQQTLQKSSQKVFSEYLETIGDVLSVEQKTKLDEYFASQAPKATQNP
jgi:hypothetical protein